MISLYFSSSGFTASIFFCLVAFIIFNRVLFSCILETDVLRMKTRGDHTRDIPEEDLIPSFAESEACESFIQI